MAAKPALRTELLFYLSFLAAAALADWGGDHAGRHQFSAPERTFVLVMLLSFWKSPCSSCSGATS